MALLLLERLRDRWHGRHPTAKPSSSCALEPGVLLLHRLLLLLAWVARKLLLKLGLLLLLLLRLLAGVTSELRLHWLLLKARLLVSHEASGLGVRRSGKSTLLLLLLLLLLLTILRSASTASIGVEETSPGLRIHLGKRRRDLVEGSRCGVWR